MDIKWRDEVSFLEGFLKKQRGDTFLSQYKQKSTLQAKAKSLFSSETALGMTPPLATQQNPHEYQ